MFPRRPSWLERLCQCNFGDCGSLPKDYVSIALRGDKVSDSCFCNPGLPKDYVIVVFWSVVVDPRIMLLQFWGLWQSAQRLCYCRFRADPVSTKIMLLLFLGSRQFAQRLCLRGLVVGPRIMFVQDRPKTMFSGPTCWLKNYVIVCFRADLGWLERLCFLGRGSQPKDYVRVDFGVWLGRPKDYVDWFVAVGPRDYVFWSVVVCSKIMFFGLWQLAREIMFV